jgi:hypothetical protein
MDAAVIRRIGCSDWQQNGCSSYSQNLMQQLQY